MNSAVWNLKNGDKCALFPCFIQINNRHLSGLKNLRQQQRNKHQTTTVRLNSVGRLNVGPPTAQLNYCRRSCHHVGAKTAQWWAAVAVSKVRHLAHRWQYVRSSSPATTTTKLDLEVKTESNKWWWRIIWYQSIKMMMWIQMTISIKVQWESVARTIVKQEKSLIRHLRSRWAQL